MNLFELVMAPLVAVEVRCPKLRPVADNLAPRLPANDNACLSSIGIKKNGSTSMTIPATAIASVPVDASRLPASLPAPTIAPQIG